MESISLGAMDYLVKGEFNNTLLAKSIQYSIERKKANGELADEKIRQQKLITEIALQVQEREKIEIGRELHDNVSQILATTKMFLGMAKSGKELAWDKIEKSYEYVTLAIEELRKLSHSLVTPALNGRSLKKVMKNLVNEINSLNKVRIELMIDEKIDEKEIDKSKELMIYRVLQEQINNITKYANAKKASITLKSEKGNLILTIIDNGVGFDTSAESNGIGIKNIKSRVDHYSGTTKIVSAPGKGCRLEVCVPL
jgi:two-component system sensor histidine kinase UhpB